MVSSQALFSQCLGAIIFTRRPVFVSAYEALVSVMVTVSILPACIKYSMNSHHREKKLTLSS